MKLEWFRYYLIYFILVYFLVINIKHENETDSSQYFYYCLNDNLILKHFERTNILQTFEVWTNHYIDANKKINTDMKFVRTKIRGLEREKPRDLFPANQW